jgi:hypothetical protein
MSALTIQCGCMGRREGTARLVPLTVDRLIDASFDSPAGLVAPQNRNSCENACPRLLAERYGGDPSGPAGPVAEPFRALDSLQHLGYAIPP